ncbi:MAG: hypothetical protein M3Z01_03705 [Thermoproteota archaeon]|nr:hypothetical protein [Thermoproteota archaeon]
MTGEELDEDTIMFVFEAARALKPAKLPNQIFQFVFLMKDYGSTSL